MEVTIDFKAMWIVRHWKLPLISRQCGLLDLGSCRCLDYHQHYRHFIINGIFHHNLFLRFALTYTCLKPTLIAILYENNPLISLDGHGNRQESPIFSLINWKKMYIKSIANIPLFIVYHISMQQKQ